MIQRDNVSLISMAKQYGSKSIETIYGLFNNIIGNVHAYGLADKILDFNIISKFYYQDPKLFNFLKEILIKTDTGISDVEIQERIDLETKEKLTFRYLDIT